jgi:hypothetical protein
MTARKAAKKKTRKKRPARPRLAGSRSRRKTKTAAALAKVKPDPLNAEEAAALFEAECTGKQLAFFKARAGGMSLVDSARVAGLSSKTNRDALRAALQVAKTLREKEHYVAALEACGINAHSILEAIKKGLDSADARLSSSVAMKLAKEFGWHDADQDDEKATDGSYEERQTTRAILRRIEEIRAPGRRPRLPGNAGR